MDETMIEINAVIDQLASKLIQKDEFDYDIKDALTFILCCLFQIPFDLVAFLLSLVVFFAIR